MGYFHIWIELKEQNKQKHNISEYYIDILANKKDEIIKNIFDPYVSGQSFIFNGLSLTKSDIKRLQITYSEYSSSIIVDIENEKYRGSDMIFVRTQNGIVFDKNFTIDVTLDFINEAKKIFVPVEQKQENNDLLSHLHEKIREASYQKYKDRHYADAVESAFKEINDRLKKLYKKIKGSELDGNKLFAQVFHKDPDVTLLKVDDLSTESGKDEQNGYCWLLMGAWSSQRNPKAHANLYITEDEAYDRLILASMLMKRIDKAIKYTFEE